MHKVNQLLQKTIIFLAGTVIGACSIVIGEALWKSSESAFMAKATNLKYCQENAGQDEAQRAVRMSDCMAANGYLFIGAYPGSACYGEHPFLLTLKHALSSCYSNPSFLSRFAP